MTTEQLWAELTELQEIWNMDYGWEVFIEIEDDSGIP